jgi:hypothetical protein
LSAERLARAAGDWWLYSLADAHIGPGSSGYSRTGFAYGLKDKLWMMEPFEGRYWYGESGVVCGRGCELAARDKGG